MSDARRILGAMSTSAPLANLITLGVRDLPALRNFYRELGWPQVMDDGEFVAFELRGIVLALFPLAKLARDGNTNPDPGTGGIRFTIGIMVDGADDVDRLTQMRAAGARVTKEPVGRVLRRTFGLPLRARRQLLRDRLGRHAQQPRRHRNPTSCRRLSTNARPRPAPVSKAIQAIHCGQGGTNLRLGGPSTLDLAKRTSPAAATRCMRYCARNPRTRSRAGSALH
jgi:uncharacterized protein